MISPRVVSHWVKLSRLSSSSEGVMVAANLENTDETLDLDLKGMSAIVNQNECRACGP